MGKTADHNASIAIEFVLGSADSAVVNGLDGYLNLEDIVGNDANLSHMHSLGASHGVTIKNPTILTTVLHVDAGLEHLNESVVVNFITKDLDLLSKALTEDRLTFDERLNDLLGSEVNHTSLLVDDLSKGRLSACWETHDTCGRSVCQVLGHWLTSNSVFAGLCQELFLLVLVAQEVETLTVENRELLGLTWVKLGDGGRKAKFAVLPGE